MLPITQLSGDGRPFGTQLLDSAAIALRAGAELCDLVFSFLEAGLQCAARAEGLD